MGGRGTKRKNGGYGSGRREIERAIEGGRGEGKGKKEGGEGCVCVCDRCQVCKINVLH